MRNFEERMQEIHKRSRAHIIRRRRLLSALCLPFVATLCVIGALFPLQTSGLNTQTVPNVTTLPQYSYAVTVVNGSESVTYSDPDTVDSVSHLISNLLPFDATAEDADQRYYRVITAQFTSLSRYCSIVLETEDGTAHYKLVDKMLIHQETGEWYVLSDVQNAMLSTLLELY